MKLKEIVTRNRSIRRFDESSPLSTGFLTELIDLARLTASGSNKQPLKYIAVSGSESREKIFPTLAWAGYFKDWEGPGEGERPAGYIILVNDSSIADSPGVDHGIAAQTILLGAAEKGIGGCMIGSFRKKELADILDLGPRYDIVMVLALGKSAETVRIEDVKNGDIKYYRTGDGIHHVPKRSLEEILLREPYV